MTTADTLLLRCQDAARTYGHGPAAVVAVNSATCQVHVGDRIAITGPSGSGKSTLLHLMADVEQPTAGEISWPGLPRVPAHGQVGVVGQGLTLVPALNVAENAALPLVLAGVPRERARQRALHCLSVVAATDLAHKMRPRASARSRGMPPKASLKVRSTLARARPLPRPLRSASRQPSAPP
ncbi:ATP-binding cassette domain-containing protein [Streptomyces sp. NPDC054838]